MSGTHLLFNMFALWSFGRAVYDVGFMRFFPPNWSDLTISNEYSALIY